MQHEPYISMKNVTTDARQVGSFWNVDSYLHSNQPIVDHHLLCEKICTNGSFVLIRKLPIYILVHQ